MRVLLAHNSTYYPSHGGGDISNRLLMEALAQRGHQVRVVTRVERFGTADHDRLFNELVSRGVRPDVHNPEILSFLLNGVDVRVLTVNPNIRGYLSDQIVEFDPDVIITSTDDPGQLLFGQAVESKRARIVYLVRATIAVPFGPESSSRNLKKTQSLGQADAIVCVSEYVAAYVREWSGLASVHVPISLMETRQAPAFVDSFENPFITLVNPCAVKGIDIFLELAAQMRDLSFAAVPTWGTTLDDLAALKRHSNITILPATDDIDQVFRLTKVLLVPSVWAEARSRLLMEAMSRGIPVVASDIGGLREAHLGVDYLIPINPITRYQASVDTNMVPVASVPPQDVEPWKQVVRKLVSDREHYLQIASASYAAAGEYLSNLTVEPFENLLEGLCRNEAKRTPGIAPAASSDLTPEKKKLLALLVRKRGNPQRSNRWLAGIEDHKPERLLLFCFPHAGGGTSVYRAWRESLVDVATVCAIRLPGRESRMDEPMVESIPELVDSLQNELKAYEGSRFAYFGHSMGAIIAFELARKLPPQALFASAARSPVYRLNHHPAPASETGELIEDIKNLGGLHPGAHANQQLLNLVLPAVKADTELYRTYRYESHEPLLDVPVFAYHGLQDPNINTLHAGRWREITKGQFQRREFEGGHFYFSTAPGFLTSLREDLKGL